MNYLLIAKFEINSTKNNFIKMKFFLIIKKHIFKFEFRSFEFIIDDHHICREIKNVNKFVRKLKQFKLYLRNELI